MRSIRTSIDINASAEKVWGILTDFERYPEWNPFVIAIKGRAVVGEMLIVTLRPPGGKPMDMKPRVVAAEENRHFGWLGHLFMPGIFSGSHFFKIEAKPNGGLTFLHGEDFSGILRVPVMAMIGKSTIQGFEAMNEALKKRAEQ